MINKTCYCGTEFNTYPSKIKIGKGKYCSKDCSMKVTNKKLITNGIASRFKERDMPHNFKGYRYVMSRKGGSCYRLLYMPEHPDATSSGHIREHRYTMEKKLGRRLMSHEIVHHIDGETLNNVVSNLQVMNKKDHDRMNTPLNIHRRWVEREIPVRSLI